MGFRVRCAADLGFSSDEALSDLHENRLVLHPNPVRKMVSNHSRFTGGFMLEIFNLLGESVYSDQIIPSQVDVNLGFLKEGVYIIRLRSEQESI